MPLTVRSVLSKLSGVSESLRVVIVPAQCGRFGSSELSRQNVEIVISLARGNRVSDLTVSCNRLVGLVRPSFTLTQTCLTIHLFAVSGVLVVCPCPVLLS